VTQGNFRRGRP